MLKNLIIQDKNELRLYVKSLFRKETFRDPIIYKKGLITGLKSAGFDPQWLETEFMNEFNNILAINQMLKKIQSINTESNPFYKVDILKNLCKKLFDRGIYTFEIYRKWTDMPFSCKILNDDELIYFKHTAPDYRIITGAFLEYIDQNPPYIVELTNETKSLIDEYLHAIKPCDMMAMDLRSTGIKNFDTHFAIELNSQLNNKYDYINLAHIYSVEKYYK